MRSRALRLSPLVLFGLAVVAGVASCSGEEEGGASIVIVPGGKSGAGGSKGGAGGTANPGGSGNLAGQGASAGNPGVGGSGVGSGGSGLGGSGQAGSNSGGANVGGTSAAGTSGSSGTTGGSAGSTATSLFFVSPQEGQTFQQVGSPAEVQIHFEVQASSSIAKVDYRIENGDLMASKADPPGFPHDHPFKIAGQRWVEAQGYGADGALLASAKVNFTVKAPSLGGCLDELTALGVSFTTTKAKGVVDAVKLQGPINGVLFASGLKETPSTDPMACEFVKTLWSFAEVVKAHGFVRVGTLGSYCYRCCCSWSETNYCRGPDDPEPDCSANGYSNHSWGRAVDVRYLVKADGTTYDVNNPDHFVTYGGTDTCGAGIAKQSGISLTMYKIVCEARDKKVFSTTLTPNYNSAHRNHFHMDTGKSGAATGAVTKILPDLFFSEIDVGEHADSCGP